MIVTFVFISSKTQQTQTDLKESFSADLIHSNVQPRIAKTLGMDETGSLKDHVKEVRGKATWVRGSGSTCSLGMEEEEKLSRDKQERLRSWNSREKSVFQNWGVNNIKCYREFRKNQSPNRFPGLSMQKLREQC